MELVWRLDVEGTWGRTWAEGAPEMGCLCWSLHIWVGTSMGCLSPGCSYLCFSHHSPTAVLSPVVSWKRFMEK